MDLAVQVGADDDDPMLWRARDALWTSGLSCVDAQGFPC